MTTPWERSDDEGFKKWLLDRQVDADEFNALTLRERIDVRAQSATAAAGAATTASAPQLTDWFLKFDH